MLYNKSVTNMSKNFLIAISLSVVFFSLIVVAMSNSKNKPVKITENSACTYTDLSGNFDFSQKVAVFEGQEIEIPSLAYDNTTSNVLSASSEERWIEVDLSDQKLYAWEGNKLFLETAISSGLPWWPTPTGEFKIWIKLRATRMEGGEGKYYYNLPNVPYVMYFGNDVVPNWRGFGLHGAYWHNSFGTPRSHGCVNLPIETAKNLYYWVGPVLEDGKSSIKSTESNPGTRIVIHE